MIVVFLSILLFVLFVLVVMYCAAYCERAHTASCYADSLQHQGRTLERTLKERDLATSQLEAKEQERKELQQRVDYWYELYLAERGQHAEAKSCVAQVDALLQETATRLAEYRKFSQSNEEPKSA